MAKVKVLGSSLNDERTGGRDASEDSDGIGRRLMSSIASGVQKNIARKLAAEYADGIRMIVPEALGVLIDNHLPLKPILDRLLNGTLGSKSVEAKDEILTRILRLDPVVVTDALCHVHPALRPVLDNDKGLAWLKAQREALRKQ